MSYSEILVKDMLVSGSIKTTGSTTMEMRAFCGQSTSGSTTRHAQVRRGLSSKELVMDMNVGRLQEVVDKGLRLICPDAQAIYAITVGTRGHKTRKVGQVTNRTKL